MTGEGTVPFLQCAAVDEVVTFHEAPGFRRTYRQTKPNPYAVVRRKNSGDLSGFTVVAPAATGSGGSSPPPRPTGDPARAEQARRRPGQRWRAGRRQGDLAQAAKILDGALARETGAPERVEALTYRAELPRRAGDDAAPRRCSPSCSRCRSVPPGASS